MNHRAYDRAIFLLDRERVAIEAGRIASANIDARAFRSVYVEFLDGRPPKELVDELRRRKAQNRRLRRLDPTC